MYILMNEFYFNNTRSHTPIQEFNDNLIESPNAAQNKFPSSRMQEPFM